MGGGGGQCIGSRRGGTTGSRWGVLRNCESSICVFVFPLSRRCHTTLGTLFCSHPLALLAFRVFSHHSLCRCCCTRNPFYESHLTADIPFLLSFGRFWSCRTAACKVVLGCSPSTVACLSPNVQLLSLQYFIFRRISYPSHNLAVPWRSTLNIGKALVLESLGNERIKHRHRNCSCGPGLRRLYLPYAASAGRLTSSGCPKIAISDLERSQVARDSN